MSLPKNQFNPGGARNLPPNPTSQKTAASGGNPYGSIEFEDLQNHPGATFDQRLIALTIDILVLTFLGKGLDSFLEIFNINDDAIGLIFFVSYFSLMHWWYGFTVGKYFVGLRVIGEGQRTFSAFSRFFFRESAGKFLSMIPLFLGFFAIIFGRERLSWHDRLSQTKVISLKHTESSVGRQLLRGGLALFFLLALVLGFGGFTVLMTPVPLENLQQRLTWAGIHLQGISGSLVRGYTIGKLHWQRDGNKVSLEDIRVKIDPWSFLAGRGNVHVQSLSVASGEIDIQSSGAEKGDAKSQGETAETDAGDDGAFLAQFVRSLRIDSFDLSNVKVQYGKTDVLLSRFFVSNLKANLDEFRFGRMYIDSSKVQIDVSDFKIAQGLIEMPTPLKGLIKTSLEPDLFKTEVSFSVKAFGSRERPDFEVALFNSQIKLSRRDKKMTFEAVDWSPTNYLKGYWSISRLTLKSEGVWDDSPDFTSCAVSGDFRILPSLFKVSEGQTLASVISEGLKAETGQNAEKTAFVLKPQFFHDKQPWMQAFRNGQPMGLDEALANSRSGKSLSELPETEKALVAKDVDFFSRSFLFVENLVQPPHLGREPATIKSTELHVDDDHETEEDSGRDPASEDEADEDFDDEPIDVDSED